MFYSSFLLQNLPGHKLGHKTDNKLKKVPFRTRFWRTNKLCFSIFLALVFLPFVPQALKLNKKALVTTMLTPSRMRALRTGKQAPQGLAARRAAHDSAAAAVTGQAGAAAAAAKADALAKVLATKAEADAAALDAAGAKSAKSAKKKARKKAGKALEAAQVAAVAAADHRVRQ